MRWTLHNVYFNRKTLSVPPTRISKKKEEKRQWLLNVGKSTGRGESKKKHTRAGPEYKLFTWNWKCGEKRLYVLDYYCNYVWIAERYMYILRISYFRTKNKIPFFSSLCCSVCECIFCRVLYLYPVFSSHTSLYIMAFGFSGIFHIFLTFSLIQYFAAK